MEQTKRKKKKNANYVDNKEFNKLIKHYFETESNLSYQALGKIFLKIAKNILNRPNFVNYSYDRKEDMVSDATYNMVRYIKSYDVKHNNPFAYFSQLAFNAFKQDINKKNKDKKLYTSLDYVENMVGGESESYE